MYFDVFTISALVDELRERLVGGRAQDVLDVTEAAIGLEIYNDHQRYYLLLDADPNRPRAHLVDGKLRRGLPKPTQLGLLMRRYVESGFLVDITQPVGERVLILHFDSPLGLSQVIVEAIERRANILLVQEGLILDCVRRVGAQDNRVRVSLPGRDYVEPPPQVDKVPAGMVEVGEIAAWLDEIPGDPAWRILSRHIQGVSPLLAREMIFQAVGRANASAADCGARAVFSAYAELIKPLLKRAWRPGMTRDESGRVTSFSTFEVTYLPGWEASPSISAALEAYYGAPVGEDAYQKAKEPVLAQIREALARVGHKAESLREGLRSEAELTHIRQAGELLLAYQYTIPRGATEFEAQYDLDGPPVRIKLDPALSALDNAKEYFEKYDKAKRALEGVPALLQAAENELAFLKQLETDLALAANWPEIDEVRDALERDGHWRGPRQTRPQTGKSAPLKVSTPDGYVIWVGRNSRQNDQVTFDKGAPDDVWCHVRGMPGAHVIIKTGGRGVPEDVLSRAAALAAYYSAARGEGRAEVDYTLRKYVRKIKGGKPGQVTYRNETVIEVRPADVAAEE